ncbi:MAG: poly(beta-D-mannuronate) lyase [Paracoccaceae bacterium]|jgi:poly(beta-D-mannuronate) lyase
MIFMLRKFVMVAITGTLLPALAEGSTDCAQAPEPVSSLNYGSRYKQSDAPGTTLDPAADSAATETLKPVDDFLRSLTKLANQTFDKDNNQIEVANCVLSQIAVWATANALEDLQTKTARLTIGSRISGFGLVTLQALPYATNETDLASISDWLGRLMASQMVFWEEDAPDGAKRGNLRAWAALAGAAVSTVVDDPVMLGWSAWSTQYVICTARPDGSLPQEMLRGKHALHYQLHAISPLVVAAALFERQGISVRAACDEVLDKIVGFALDDLQSGGRTAAITGEVQSYFDGSEELKPFSLAWIEAYLTLGQVPERDHLEAMAEQYRPLNSSKLGGNQTLIWSDLSP